MYGRRKSYRKHSRRSAKKGMVPVPKKKVKFSRKSALAVNRNTKAIATMKEKLHGRLQKNIQVSRYTGSEIGLRPQNNRPICLDITDFTSGPNIPAAPTGARIFQYNPTGTLTEVGGWTKAPFDINPYHLGQNSDVPDGGSYLPVSCTLVAKIWGGPDLIKQTRVRVDLVSLRANKLNLQTAAFQQMTMPQGLRWMENLADPERNALSRNYFKVYATKWVNLNSRQQDTFVADPGTPGTFRSTGQTSTTLNYRYVKFHIRPKKVRHQVVTTGFSNPTQTEFPDGNFGYLNVPQDEPLWMIISTSSNFAVAPELPNNVYVSLRRSITWRDAAGSGNV